MNADGSDARAREALRAYGLGEATISVVPVGMINACFRVKAGGRDYLLKCYHPGLAEFRPEALRFVCSTQEWLRGQGVPIPAVLPTPDGALVLETEGGCFTLSDFVEGRQFARGHMPVACAREMGAALAAVHAVMSGLSAAEPHPIATPKSAYQRIEGLLRIVEGSTDRSGVDETAEAILRAKLRALEHWERPLPRAAPHWIHGDFQDTNAIFSNGDQVAAIVDWDAMRCRDREHEIMRAFAFSFPDGAPGGPEFLESYVRAARLTRAQAGSLVPLWDFTSTARTWPIEARYEQPELYQDRWDVFIEEPSGWWEANRDRLHALLVRWAGTPDPK